MMEMMRFPYCSLLTRVMIVGTPGIAMTFSDGV